MSETNYWQEIEKAFNEVDIYEGPEIFRRGAAEFPEWQIDLLSVHWAMSEIVNGGVEQFFANSTGVLAPEAVLGLEKIGKPHLAQALKQAMNLLGEDYPTEEIPRRERLAAVTGRNPVGSQAFSLIPKWVRNSVGMDSDEGPKPFAEFDSVLMGAREEVESAMDDYAMQKAD